MATLSVLGQIAGQPDFINRIAVSMSAAAIAIYNEGTGVTGHVARAAFATKVLNGTYSLSAAVLGVLASATIQGEAVVNVAGNAIADADINNQISAMWNALAGA